MRIVDVKREKVFKRHAIEFEHNNINWFMFIRDDVFHDPMMFKSWLQSVINEAKIRL